MKLSRNVLVGSLATVGMVLGAVAPAVTAQAATTSGVVGSDGSVTGTKASDGKTFEQVPAEGNGDLAIAYDNGDGTTVGSATMESNANVKVVNGLLVLNAVPDFGFGSAAMGTKVGLENNKYDQPAADSTNADAVKITESRAGAPGFSLSAQIGKFSTTGDEQNFTLSLLPTALTDSDGKSASTVKTNSVNLEGTDTAASPLIDLAAGSYNVGQVNASFAPSDKNVFLKLGDTASSTTPDKASVKSYNANITWTLTAKPTQTETPAG